MASVPVFELRRKYDLASEYVTGSMEALAARLGKSVKTILGWVNDDRSRSTESMPAKAKAQFVTIFAEVLPDLPRHRVLSLVEGPASHLRHELERAAASVLSRIIAREASGEGIRLMRPSSENPLVNAFEESPGDLPRLKLGQAFRIEFPARYDCPFALALQNAGRRWGCLQSQRSLDTRTVLVPSPREPGTEEFISEEEQPGRHRFICLHSADPFPAALHEYADEPIELDKRGLELVASFYERLPKARRACHLKEIWIEKPRFRT
ncbi:MAG: hypothetical protein B7Y08_06500 [Rhodospirillales bacterium 24-66-33]|jgi:hypothetical protein|uniref:hypothetical protein n=1 Tax=Reyranella sp. TaxID=1929291 RepID=UPI000BDCFFDE|nr:hypothetical protein [Reyranella sp.]OYY41100.1 MAG: hypothetical protein B7Y57_16240 [Rhodospirillales bacterium 35-66-84]OYZ96070.1 MAG: hypothetical protein B7Y08_06500 [Rhodospirillales bacterium 24-66-33]OZB21217.1 MAG: hypothetical protein B7X63_28025 [Rhodospirillales bacterium 39-66-50]HQS14888.1 hypothetical protein [Reyranella sp.]HQT14275.1 hypothetical protein [Reyranella sp.]